MTYWQRFFLTLYALLFALSVVLIDPWGGNRGEIWTQPKVTVLWYITLLHLGFLLLTFVRPPAPANPRANLSPQWRRAAWLWGLFLAAGLVSALFSPAGFAGGVRAHLEMGDGWAYYALLAVFSLSNVLVLRVRPELFRVQLYGVLAAGFVLALAMVPQVFDWTVDYTATSGQVSTRYAEMLVSTMWKGQMPLGFYTSRGHAGFVLAATAALALVSLLRGWLKPAYAWLLLFLVSFALWSTATRGVYIAYVAGLLYVGWRFAGRGLSWRRATLTLSLSLLGFAALAGLRGAGVQPHRSVPSLSSFEVAELSRADAQTLTSARSELWRSALVGIAERPLFGWGFNGFGIAWPYVGNWREARNQMYLSQEVPIAEVESVGHYSFSYLGTDEQLRQGRVRTNKAHNMVLDMGISLGLVGLLLYVALFGYVAFVGFKGRGWGLEAVAVVYLAYGLTWFESAQYSHLAWWALSAGFALALRPLRPPPTDTVVEERVASSVS